MLINFLIFLIRDWWYHPRLKSYSYLICAFWTKESVPLHRLDPVDFFKIPNYEAVNKK